MASTPFPIVAAAPVTTPAVTIAAPSAAAGALTRYVLGFNVSATGGLSGEAGSTITVSLPSASTSARTCMSWTDPNGATSTDEAPARGQPTDDAVLASAPRRRHRGDS